MCTASILSGKICSAQHPILLKHRDISSSGLHHKGSCVEYQPCKKFGPQGVLAITDIVSKGKGRALAGLNKAGFAIVNTATYNLGTRDFSSLVAPSLIMHEALCECEFCGDFEKVLKRFRGRLLPSNYGIIDGSGEGMLYEVSQHNWEIRTLEDAPENYLSFTNFSFSGENSNHPGLERFISLNVIMDELCAREKSITPIRILDEVSRSFRSDFLKIDLRQSGSPFGSYFPDGSFIPLRNSTFSSVFHNGVCWVALGYPPVSVSVPLVVGHSLPSLLEDVREYSRIWRDMVFDVNYGEGNRYFNFSRLWNDDNTGFIQRIKRVEEWAASHFPSETDEAGLNTFYEMYRMQVEDMYGYTFDAVADGKEPYRLCAFDDRKDFDVPSKTNKLRALSFRKRLRLLGNGIVKRT